MTENETASQRKWRLVRENQEARAKRFAYEQRAKHPRKPRKARGERRPAWGSQEWAETRGDDLGESPDY